MFCNDTNEICFRYKAKMKGYIMFTQNIKFLLVVALMSLTVASVNAKDKLGLQNEIDQRIAADLDLQNQINTIELTPGPAGDDGADGEDILSGYYGLNTGNGDAGRGGDCTLGEMILFAGVVGIGLPANGQLLDISTNTALFSLLGTIYGGDGRTTFQLPDMRAITPNEMTWYICVAGVYPSPM